VLFVCSRIIYYELFRGYIGTFPDRVLGVFSVPGICAVAEELSIGIYPLKPVDCLIE